jgi:Double zinc ribbon
MRQREIEIHDVGGLTLEMARRDAWNPDLLAARTGEVLAIEERIAELDSMLVAAEAAARGIGAERCVCGAPIVRGAHFCSHCGRPATETPPLVTCSHCGQPLPADVNFCPVCGHAVAAEEFAPEDVGGSTLVEPAPPRPGEAGGP